MTTEAIRLPPVSKDFRDTLYQLAMQIGWRNAAKRIVFGPVAPEPNVAELEAAIAEGLEAIGKNGHSVDPLPATKLNVPERAVPQNQQVSDACFTPCVTHTPYGEIEGPARQTWQWLRECEHCRELTRRAMVEHARLRTPEEPPKRHTPRDWRGGHRPVPGMRRNEAGGWAAPNPGAYENRWYSLLNVGIQTWGWKGNRPAVKTGSEAKSALQINRDAGIRPFRWEDTYR